MSLKDKLAKHKASKKAGARGITTVTELIGADEQVDVTELVERAKSDGRLIGASPEKFRSDASQPRKTFDDAKLIELQRSIESIGQLQPIVVHPMAEDGTYKIIAGERRWRAIRQSAKVENVEAVIVNGTADELAVLKMQIHENNERDSVNALEHAQSIIRGVELCRSHGAGNDKEAANMLGVSAASVSKCKSLLKAPEPIKALSESDLVQDSEALYELSKSYNKDPIKTEKLIDDIKNEKVHSVRQAAKKLESELKTSKKSLVEITRITINKDVLELAMGRKTEKFKLGKGAIESLKGFTVES